MAQQTRKPAGGERRRIGLQALLERRRRRRVVGAAAAAVLVGVAMAADHHGWLLYEGGAMGRYDGRRARVSRVVDGDTLEIALADGERPVTRVRLWGVNAPALAYKDRPAEAGAGEARRYLRDRLLGRRVRLTLEPHRVRGRYGRVLAFVAVTDDAARGEAARLVNEALLIEGLARADGRWSHRHVERFRLLELQARRDERGIWGPRAADGE